MQIPISKAKLEHIGNDLKITIPSQKNLKFPLFMILWFFGWYLAYNFALDKPGLFLKFWLAMWKLAGVLMVFMMFWFFFGFEKLIISKSDIMFSMSIFGIVFYRKILEHQFVKCKYNQEGIDRQEARKGTIYLLTIGKIKIESVFTSYVFGAALGVAEALRLVERINNKISK